MSTVQSTSLTNGIGLQKANYWLFVLMILAWCGVLCGGFFFQFVKSENPCPLCLLQRMAMALSAMGAVYVVTSARKGTLTVNGYMGGLGVGILGALTGASISTRQILLHIKPGDAGYGEPLFGLHLYTYALIAFMAMVVVSSALLLGGQRILPVMPSGNSAKAASLIGQIVIWLLILILFVNVVSVLFEAKGAWLLPDMP